MRISGRLGFLMISLLAFTGCYSATYDNIVVTGSTETHYRTVCTNQGPKILCASYTCADETTKQCNLVSRCEQDALTVPTDKGVKFCPSNQADGSGTNGSQFADGSGTNGSQLADSSGVGHLRGTSSFGIETDDAGRFELDRTNIAKTTIVPGKPGQIQCTFEGGAAASQTPVLDGHTIRLPQPVETATCAVPQTI